MLGMDGRKRVIVALSEDEYRRLEEISAKYERAPDQQATWLIRRAISRLPAIQPQDRREAVPA